MTLKQRLARAGITVTGGEALPELATPWFVRVLQAFSGWLAALFLLGFIAVGALFVLDSEGAAAGLGVVLIAAAFGTLQLAKSDFLEHLALAVSLVGQLLLAWELFSAMEKETAGLWWALLVLQVLLALMMPSLTHRAFSAFSASVALFLALHEGLAAAGLAGGLVLLLLTLLWLNEFRWPDRLRALEALGLGLLLGLVAIQAVTYFAQPLLTWRYAEEPGAMAWLEPWGGSALGALALLLLVRHLLKRHAGRLAAGVRPAAYGAVLAVALLSLQAHGLLQGVVVIVLGFAIGHRWLLGGGVLLLLLASANYYYWLEVSLLHKALSLFGLGGLLLVLRWLLRRYWPARAGDGEKRADPC
ncbi:MAG: DUF4401 domain-containing protein [Halomonadaceae bacterium]|nr:DUF4401 domain-containing protein [Halomonadaceae bacterium]